jgi:hypothetical protein
MKSLACPICGAELGPWEWRACLSCAIKKPTANELTNADAAAWVLERESGARTVYDISRAIARELHRSVALNSLNVALASDRRFCWAGKGAYGLYRHGLFPGPRGLADVARLFLYAAGDPIPLPHLAFCMKHAGYRFRDISLGAALSRDALVARRTDGKYRLLRRGEAKRELIDAGTGKGPAGFRRSVVKCQATVSSALDEFNRRLGIG